MENCFSDTIMTDEDYIRYRANYNRNSVDKKIEIRLRNKHIEKDVRHCKILIKSLSKAKSQKYKDELYKEITMLYKKTGYHFPLVVEMGEIGYDLNY